MGILTHKNRAATKLSGQQNEAIKLRNSILRGRTQVTKSTIKKNNYLCLVAKFILGVALCVFAGSVLTSMQSGERTADFMRVTLPGIDRLF